MNGCVLYIMPPIYRVVSQHATSITDNRVGGALNAIYKAAQRALIIIKLKYNLADP